MTDVATADHDVLTCRVGVFGDRVAPLFRALRSAQAAGQLEEILDEAALVAWCREHVGEGLDEECALLWRFARLLLQDVPDTGSISWTVFAISAVAVVAMAHGLERSMPADAASPVTRADAIAQLAGAILNLALPIADPAEASAKIFEARKILDVATEHFFK